MQAATLSIQSGQDDLSGEIAAARKSAEVLAIEKRWKKELSETGTQLADEAEFTVLNDDPAGSAIKFLEQPPLGGLIDISTRKDK